MSKENTYDWLIVGAGFAGSVLAERLASQRRERVLVIDRRPHIAGNAYDHLNEDGLLVHQYGPHIFHTNAMSIVNYLSQFTGWRPYEHRVLARVKGDLFPIPINIDTVNKFYGTSLTAPEDMEAFLNLKRVRVPEVNTSEDVVISTVGRELYEAFFRGYTRKQWGLDPSQLSKAVTARIPTRTNNDDRYFTDQFQMMPSDGYTAMFRNMLDNPLIDVELGVDFAEVGRRRRYKRLIYTGPIDEYFDFQLGRLPYRSLRFRHVTVDQEWVQPVGVINYPGDEEHTRITEYKHLTGQTHPKSALTYEYPSATGDPYYPIPREENHELYRRYRALAGKLNNVWFVGRLGSYQYFNMDQVVGQALSTFSKIESTLASQVDLQVRAPEMGNVSVN